MCEQIIITDLFQQNRKILREEEKLIEIMVNINIVRNITVFIVTLVTINYVLWKWQTKNLVSIRTLNA